MARDAREPLCAALWERGCIALADSRRKADGPNGPETSRFLREAKHASEDGLRVARECGFGIFHIDLLLLHAAITLEEGNPTSAITDATTALETGVAPSLESGQPRLLAAAHSECGYAWGIGLAHHLLAQASLLQAAQQRGRADFSFAHPPSALQETMEAALRHLAACLEVRQRIQDPDLKESERLSRLLKEGRLTDFRL